MLGPGIDWSAALGPLLAVVVIVLALALLVVWWKLEK